MLNQLLIGASFPFAVALLLYIVRRGRASWAMLIWFPVLTVASAVWAIVPDIPRFLGMSNLYLRLSHDPRCDLFYWHYTIDLAEHDSPLYAVGFMLMVACGLK